jgi:pimeloyl-ACP methyl ester carboxylesterase
MMPSFRTSDGVSLHYREAGAGAPIVLLPGAFVGTQCYQRQLDLLSAHHRVIAVDLRGQGQSEKTALGRSVARAAMDLNELSAALELEDMTLVGWSLSVAIVLEFVELFGDQRLAGVCLVAGGPRPMNHDGWPHGILAVQAADQLRLAMEQNLEGTIRDVLPTLFLSPPANYDEILAEALLAGPPEGQAAVFWSSMTSDFRPVVRDMTIPLLVILGRHDPILSPSIGDVYTSIAPATRVEVLEAGGHSPFIEDPEHFNEVLADFVAAPAAAGSGVS